jgi:cytochrome c-type biogenesis protein CcmE
MGPVSPTISLKRRAKFIIGTAGILLVLGGLVVWAMARPGAASFYQTPTEVLQQGAAASGSEYRVNGMVVPGSVTRDGLVTTFGVTDGNSEVTVTTDRPLPDAFWTDTDQVEVIARGRYDGTTFTATEVLAKCPSKFKAKED